MKVVVGLSGGVDSSVAAYLLKQQGHEVIALFMINWHDKVGLLSGDCPNKDEQIIAEMVARKLQIPFHAVDLSEDYRKRVVDYMFSEYEKGRTPNPDVLCNREIKFDAFLKTAIEYGAEFVATGHYCQKDEVIVNNTTYYRLIAGADTNKDQSYFLCQLSQDQLSKALFPIGHLNKPEVRQIAKEIGLPTAEKKDSQGICFVGKVDLPVFLQQKLTAKKGKIIEIEETHYNKIEKNIADLHDFCAPYGYKENDGKVVGEHDGAHFFTIGQRKGLNVGGKVKPLFVIATDIVNNLIFTGQGHDHSGLNRSGLYIQTSEIHWVRPDLALQIGEKRKLLVRIRYRQPLQKAELQLFENGLYIVFDEPQRGITAGQFAAWYQNDELIGSGVIFS